MPEDREPQVAEPDHAPGADGSPPANTAASGPEAPPPAAGGASPAPAQPVNKLHEWAAAVAIMILLATILGSFIWFLRGPSM